MNQAIPSELIELKKTIIDGMLDYMASFNEDPSTVKLDLEACEAELRTHMEKVLLPSAWENPVAVMSAVKTVVFSLNSIGYDHMLRDTSEAPSGAADLTGDIEKCRTVIDLFLGSLLAPPAQADIAKLILALKNTMFGLTRLSFDCMYDYASKKEQVNSDAGYTETEVMQCDAVLTDFLAAVLSSPAKNNPTKIMAAVQHAVISLNVLNDRCGRNLIETDQREDICRLVTLAAASAGLPPGEQDITWEWRDW